LTKIGDWVIPSGVREQIYEKNGKIKKLSVVDKNLNPNTPLLIS
jgi:hypothetical protein